MTITGFALTAILTALVFLKATSLIISGFNALARNKAVQTKLLHEFDDIASQFLRRTESVDVPIIRETVATMPSIICDRAFAYSVFVYQPEGSKQISNRRKTLVSEEVKRLSPAQEDLLAEAFGTGLIAATYSSPLLGGLMRKAIFSTVDQKERKVGSPQQTVITLQSRRKVRRDCTPEIVA